MTASAPTGPPVVCLSPIPWSGQWTSRHEIATELARRGRPVLFVEPPRNVLRRPPRPAADRPEPAGIARTTPPAYLPYGILGRTPRAAATAIALNARRYADHVARAAGGHAPGAGRTLVLNSFMPVLGHTVAARLPDAAHLYHRTDELRSFPSHQPLHERYEHRVLREADAVACSSPTLAAAVRHVRADAAVVRNGVDVGRFADATPDPRVARMPGPVAVLVGRVDHRTEPGVLNRIADAMTLVVAGPVAPGHRIPDRAHGLGPVAPDAIPSILAGADVALVPYAGFEGDPLKVYEYLAAGLPTVVVAGPWLDASPVLDALHVVPSPSDLPQAALEAARGRTLAEDEERRAVAAEQSWSARVDELLGLIDVVAAPVGS
ncbi:glycosyltransferase [Acidimicrobiia bacterium EGI L10123]|uniref:glycosyltransferase n=1 Tax=Salinilacustrithrix flava TaxID=2957203 RepID=UPI003D7C3018|nr:glycosyltransferase [Acidimicrobiia bacterium EGI L10123]